VTLVATAFVPIPPGARPGFDHADVYRPARRLYVAHSGADRVDVIDCVTKSFLHSLRELPGVAGVLIDEGHDRMFSSDRDAARVTVFRCSDEGLLGHVRVGPHPNGLAYDRRRRRLYAFNLGDPLGVGCTASVVDLDSLAVIAEFELPGRPRWAIYDDERDRVYATIREPAVVAVIDAANTRIASAFDVPCEGPHGLCLDSGRLFCAADGGALVVLDAAGGQVLETLPLPGVPDVVVNDPDLGRMYVAIGDPGVVCAFDSDRLTSLETIDTEQGAHTIGWDPVGQDLYAFLPESCGAAVYGERP